MLKIIKYLKRLFMHIGSCFYIGATDILPEPLSREDEEFFIELKDQGNIEARDKLINLYLLQNIKYDEVDGKYYVSFVFSNRSYL